MRILSVDLETFSEVDIKKAGLYKYAENSKILLFAYAWDDEPAQVVDFASGEKLPLDVADALHDPNVLKTAYNAAFEIHVINHWLELVREIDRQTIGALCPWELPPLDPAEWFCTMIQAWTLGLPGGLDKVGKVLNVAEDKQKLATGKRLIQYFSKPCKPSKANGGRTRNLPEHDREKWELFKEYCRQDVEAERAIRKRIEGFFPIPAERRLWCLDQKINDAGVLIDMPLVNAAIDLDEKIRQDAMTEAVKLTGVDNPNSNKQILDWFEEKEGWRPQSLDKEARAELMEQVDNKEVKRMLELKDLLGKTSVKKYVAMKEAVCADGRLHGMLQFYGASRTGRWAGRVVQLQNLRRNDMNDLDIARKIVESGDYDTLTMLYDNPSDVLSQLIRTAFIAKKGSRFIVADFSAIEARVIAWLAGEEWRMKVFADGGDIYCASASAMFKVPVVKHGGNGHLRAKGKVAELACIAEGQLVLTNKGLVPIEKVTTEMLLWDGENWVSHEGVIEKGKKDVFFYEGLCATPDHLVYVEGQSAPVEFGVAAFRKYHLVDYYGRRNEHLRIIYYCGKVKVYDIRNAGSHHRFTVSGKLVHNCGYGGGVAALKAFGADKMGLTDAEMDAIIKKWRKASPHIVKMWGDVESCFKKALRLKTRVGYRKGIDFSYEKGLMFIRLPSGRRIAYVKPRIEYEEKFNRESLVYDGIVQATGTWGKNYTWGGKLTENCLAEGTLVITERGLIPIESVKLDDFVWDGYEMVTHAGAICQGEQPVLKVDNFYMTANHAILTRKGWKFAKYADRYDWQKVSLPDGFKASGKYSTRKGSMALPMRMRQFGNSRGAGFKAKKAPSKVLWMQNQRIDSGEDNDTRNVQSPCFCNMALNETTLHRTESQGLEELRRSRNNGLRPLDAQLSKFLGGYGRKLPKRIGIRPHRQQQGLFTEKLPLDDPQSQQSQPSNKCGRGLPDWQNDCCRIIGTNGHRCNNDIIPTCEQLADRISVSEAECSKQVYDIRNCGPRHQFAIWDAKAQKARIVHNCVQATARDCLADSMLRLDAAGYKIVMHVHDEVILEMPYGEGSLAEVTEIMGKELSWAKGLLLTADGYETEYYRKD